MVRVDVFSKPNRRGQDAFYLVPVYVHQVMNPSLGAAGVPNRAISASSNNLSEAHFDPAALRMGMLRRGQHAKEAPEPSRIGPETGPEVFPHEFWVGFCAPTTISSRRPGSAPGDT